MVTNFSYSKINIINDGFLPLQEVNLLKRHIMKLSRKKYKFYSYGDAMLIL
ncbi:MAG: hypothetical protein ACJ0P5_05235 [Flavobacteriaceae bacterium]